MEDGIEVAESGGSSDELPFRVVYGSVDYMSGTVTVDKTVDEIGSMAANSSDDDCRPIILITKGEISGENLYYLHHINASAHKVEFARMNADYDSQSPTSGLLCTVITISSGNSGEAHVYKYNNETGSWTLLG